MSMERLGVNCTGNRITQLKDDALVHSLCVNGTKVCNDPDCGMSKRYRAPANGAERFEAYDRLVRGLK